MEKKFPDPEPIKMEMPEDLLQFLEKNSIKNIIIISLLTVIGPVLRYYIKETSFTKKIINYPPILGDIAIIGKYAKVAKIKNGGMIYLFSLYLDNKEILLIFEITAYSSDLEKFIEKFVRKIKEKNDYSPVTIIEIIEELVKK